MKTNVSPFQITTIDALTAKGEKDECDAFLKLQESISSMKQERTMSPQVRTRTRGKKQHRQTTHKVNRGRPTKGKFVFVKGTGNDPTKMSSKPKKGWKQTWIFKGTEEKPRQVYFLPRPNMPRMDKNPTSRPPAKPAVMQRPRPAPKTHLPPSRFFGTTSDVPATPPSPTITSPRLYTQAPVGVQPAGSIQNPPFRPPSTPPTIVSLAPTVTPTASLIPPVQSTPQSSNPTPQPQSWKPTATPVTPSPSLGGSSANTIQPVNSPSMVPTRKSLAPSELPSELPSTLPSVNSTTPTRVPEMAITKTPNALPTESPSQKPVSSQRPTLAPESPVSLQPVVASNERTAKPSLVTMSHSRETVQATSFFLYYTFEGRDATPLEYEAASKSTLAYLDSFMHSAFRRNDQIDHDGQLGQVIGVTMDPVSISFSYEVYFLEAPNLHPKQDDVDRLVSTALSEPANNILLERLARLDERNPFSKTTQVEYSLDFKQPNKTDEMEVPGSAIALLVVGIVLGVLGLGMILMRRRRFKRRQKVDVEQETDDLLTNEKVTTLSDSDHPAIVSSSGSAWIDTKWSLPSGHVTCAPPETSMTEAQNEPDMETNMDTEAQNEPGVETSMDTETHRDTETSQ